MASTRTPERKRENFTTRLAVVAATLSSAIGLGNIWKFPYLTGANGGAAFIVVYLICVALVGLPVMIAELLIGRAAKADAITSFETLAPKKPWYLIGVAGMLSALLIMFFYTTVSGWVYAYVFKAALGSLRDLDPNQAAAVFGSLSASPIEPLIWQWIVLAVVATIITAGVQKGIERMAKILLPVLFVLLLICDVRALTLPNAAAGISFLFKPDFSKVTAGMVLTALGLSFFKLSIGMGAMLTYGSYAAPKTDLPRAAVRVALSDTVVSLLAGLAVFPAVFAFGYKPDAGPSLLFITIPMVFNSMPFGNVFLVLFFALSAIAATGAMVSLVEVPVACITERWNMSRTRAALITVLVMAVVGVTATLSTSVLSAVKILGRTPFDLYDFLSSNLLLPIGGIAISLFVGWVLGTKRIVNEAFGHNADAPVAPWVSMLDVLIKYVAPLAIFVILLNGLNIVKF